MLAAVHIINLLPSPVIHNNTPHQLLYNIPPSYSHLRTIGCLCFPWLRPQVHGKLSPRSIPCIHLGYAQHHKGYKCYDPSTNTLYISRHVKFCESTFPYNTNNTTTSPPIPSPSPAHPLTLTPTLQTANTPNTSLSSSNPLTNDFIPTSTNPPSPSLTPSPEPTSSLIPELPQLPSPDPPSTELLNRQPTHPMLTRSRTGHSKPKQIFNLSHTLTLPPTPTTYFQAAKLPQ